MRSRLLSFALPVVALFATFTPLSYAAAVQNRINSAVNGNSHGAVGNTVSIRALHATDLGLAPANRVLSGLSLRFSLTAAQQADLDQLTIDQQNPSSPSYHQWLTPEQFGARFGLSSSDLAKVSSWLTSQGFAVTGVARSATFITFAGTVAQVTQAFGAGIHSLSFNGEQHISNLTDPVLPTAIAGVVSNITGLNDFKLKPRSRASRVQVNPNYTYTSAGTTSHYIAPGDFYTIYDVNPLLSNSINGSGVTIAVMGQSDALLPQVAAFRVAGGLSVNAPTVKLYGTDPGVVAGDVDESQLDLEWSGTVAPSANILFVYSQDVLDTSLTEAIDNNLAPIITVSYGECETFYTSAQLNTFNQLFQQANTEGITLVAAAGDAGATDCDFSGLATGGLAVDFPGSSPFFTSAGGTMFSGDVSSPSTYWNSTNGTNAGSAISHIPESAWNETTTSGGLTAGGAGGGGASAFFSKPAWQVGTGVPADSSRDVPDFSLNSGAIHDGTIVCAQGDCTNGFLAANGSIDVFGGTSVAAPSFAGMIALVEQKLISQQLLKSGQGLGNIGPNLYGLASVANVFNDITSGNNAVPCVQGTPNCATGAPIGYSTGVGYDQATGLGSINAANLVNNWTLGVPTGGGSTIGATLSNTTLTTSSAVCGISSGSLPLSVTVATGSPVVGGALYPTSNAIPSGTVQFYVDNVAVGSPMTLSNGTAAYTLNTAGLSSGSHNVSVTYSGDTTFAGSKGALLTNTNNTGIVTQIDVVSSTSPDFAITPCTGSNTVISGAAANPVVLTITPFNGFLGTVKFAVNSDTGDVFNYTFSVTPVVVNAATGVPTSFVLTATETNAAAAARRLKPVSSHLPRGKSPWYAAGSGATLACMILLTVPRRRRWGTLFALLLSVAAIGAVGCGTNTSTTGGGGGGGGGGGTTTPVAPGLYNLTITATSGSLVHSSVITYTVEQ